MAASDSGGKLFNHQRLHRATMTKPRHAPPRSAPGTGRKHRKSSRHGR